MDGQAASSEISSRDVDDLDENYTEAKSFETYLEEIHLIEDEQPDGQRSSLSLDDDGGTHFELHSQDGSFRRGSMLRESNLSPMLQNSSTDNDVLFNPLQRLNFDDDDYEDDEEADNCENRGNDNGIEDVENTSRGLDNDSLDDRNYFLHRPAVHGSDLSELSLYNGAMASHDQGQNIRIIEGHDSSLLDDGGNPSNGFHFLQTQMVHIPAMFPFNAMAANSSRLEEESQNLYDSLEREDGSSRYGESVGPNNHVMDNSTSEYFSAGSMNLIAANSQGPDSDLLWAQEESTENGNYLTHSQQLYQHSSSDQQSPPRNFQLDSTARRRGGAGYLNNTNFGGFGDSHNNEEDNTDALSIELSEEGLLQNTQTYAQPVSTVVPALNGAHHSQQQKDWNSWSQPNTSAQANGFGVDDSLRNAPPRNLSKGQGLSNLSSNVNGENDGADNQDKREAGAGSSSQLGDQNQSAVEPGKVVKKSASNKVQLRRPAVQGSASSSDTRKSVVANQRSALQSNPSACKKGASFSKSGSSGEKAVSKVSSAVSCQKGKPESAKGPGLTMNASSPQYWTSHASSMHSIAHNTNNRVGGVGKESHHLATPTTVSAANQVIFCSTDHGLVSTQTQREEPGQCEVSSSLSSVSQMSSAANNPPQHPQASQSFDKLRPSLNVSELRPSQSFSKPHLASGNVQALPAVSDRPTESNLHYLPPRPHDTRRVATNSSSFHPGNQPPVNSSQRFSVPSHYTSHLGHGSLQRTQSGFPIQASVHPRDSASLESNHQNRELIDGLKWQTSKSGLHVGGQYSLHHPQMDTEIQGMEEVRNQLHTMLRIGTADSTNASVADHPSFDCSDAASDTFTAEQQIKRQLHFDTEVSSLMNHHRDDMSDILENFPAFSSKLFLQVSGSSNKTDVSLQGENQYLRESLEKEKYRRKHCEEHIQKLNTKLLEVHQQLAVAISTDKRKDVMIEQLDKQLAKVVEGWKKRELEKDEFLRVLTHEKEQIEETLQSQQNMINSFERELAHTVEQLRAEKERSNQVVSDLKRELTESKQEKQNAEATFECERQKYANMLSEWKTLTESKDEAEKKAQQTQEKLVELQEYWSKKEQEFLIELNDMKEARQKVNNMEKIKLEEQKKKTEEVVAECNDLKTELKKAALDLEQLIREKESQKVEMAIFEAKFEAAQRTLESDLHAQMEKEIAEQASEFHSRIENALEEAAERHRRQMNDIHTQHQREMERQTAAISEDRLKREEEHRRQMTELEEKLQTMRAENHHLRQSKIKLESQRVEILTKLQIMMQSQWNEAVSLLVSTPQKKSLNGSFISSGHCGQLTVSDSSTSVSSLNLLAPSAPASSTAQGSKSQAVETGTMALPEPHTAKSGNESLDRTEELNRMNRVEEYLQQLNHHMDIPVSKSDGQALDINRHQEHMSGTASEKTVCGDSSTSSEVPRLQQQYPLQVSEFSGHLKFSDGGQDCPFKPSNNLNQSHYPRVHSYVNGQTSKAVITTFGPTLTDPVAGSQPSQGLTYQALPMRSPQQSSSRTNSDVMTLAFRTESAPDPPPVVNGGYTIGTPPHSQQYQQHECQQLSSVLPAMRYPQNSLFLSQEGRQYTGDFGDQGSLKTACISSGDKNLYCPDSPGHRPTDQWSPGNAASSRASYVKTAGNIAMSPPASQMVRSMDGMGSPVKKYRPRPGQFLTDSLNDSLSPPVKQTVDGQCDSVSEADSSLLDPDRIQANYSQLLENYDDQQMRQSELQHYVRMLLEKAPGSVYTEPERDLHFDCQILESSREITVDLDLNDTATAQELTSQLTRFQQLRDRQNYQSHTDHLNQPNSRGQAKDITSRINEFVGLDGVINSQGLTHISQLLTSYRDQWETASMGEASTLTNPIIHANKSEGSEYQMEIKSAEGRNHAATRKVKQMTKGKKVKVISQSAESSLLGEPRDKPVAVKANTQVSGGKKVPQALVEPGKDKMPRLTKQSQVAKGGAGSVWK